MALPGLGARRECCATRCVPGFLAHPARPSRVETMLRDVHKEATGTIRPMPSAGDAAHLPAGTSEFAVSP